MITVREIQERLGLFIAGDTDSTSFYKWLMDATWDMHKDSSQRARDMVADLQATFWERDDFYSDKRSETWFQREVLRIFAESHVASAIDLLVATQPTVCA